VVGTYTANCIDTPATIFGTLWANGVISPANPAYSANELAFQLKDSGAKALLTQTHLLKSAVEAAKIAGIPQDRILVIGDEKDLNVLHFSDFIKSTRDTSRGARKGQAASDLAFIPYSSGTTGLPKGVMLTQRNIVSNLLQSNATQSELTWNGGPEGKGDTLIAVLPFYHVYGEIASCLYCSRLLVFNKVNKANLNRFGISRPPHNLPRSKSSCSSWICSGHFPKGPPRS